MKKDQELYTNNNRIYDKWGRVCIFRGINFGVNSKTPSRPTGETWRKDSLQETKSQSFCNKPFPEEEADEHFSRMISLGIKFLRWTITWEAIEHEGPDQYDEDYLAYLRRILKKAEDYGLFVFIDPHQDTWSRWTGGDGAPSWTMEMLGFDLSKLGATDTAFTQQEQGQKYKPMTWQLNYGRYACATMFTLFFAGNTFAPGITIDGIPAQDYLQGHYIAAMKHAARRLKDCKAIIGFGTLNEPHTGFIGIPDLLFTTEILGMFGFVASPFETIKSASGFDALQQSIILTLTGSQKIIPKKLLSKTMLSKNIPAVPGGIFKDGFECPWKKMGVWHIGENGEAILDKPNYFSIKDGRPVDFASDFLKPFQKSFIQELEAKHKHYLFFIEGTTTGLRSDWQYEIDDEISKIVEAFHWYDGITLLTKKWQTFMTADANDKKPIFGRHKIEQSFSQQIEYTLKKVQADGIPAILGEFGVPFDLNNGKSYVTGDYSDQEEALGLYYDALDSLLLSGTLWNYNPDNTHSNGDGWNGEDLSIYCSDNKSLRGIKGYCRPYPIATAGIPKRIFFNRGKKDGKVFFEYEWDYVPPVNVTGEKDDDTMRTTEIFIPDVWFPNGWKAELVQGLCKFTESPDLQRLFVTGEESSLCIIRITQK